MTNEERFELLEDTIHRLERELELTLRNHEMVCRDADERYRRLQELCLDLEAKNQELNRRLFKDTQMNDKWVPMETPPSVVKAIPPSPAQQAAQAQTLQQLMQAAGVNLPSQSGTGYSNQAGIKGPAPIATANGPRCPDCYGIMGFNKLSASSTRYACLNVGCGKVIIT